MAAAHWLRSSTVWFSCFNRIKRSSPSKCLLPSSDNSVAQVEPEAVQNMEHAAVFKVSNMSVVQTRHRRRFRVPFYVATEENPDYFSSFSQENRTSVGR